MPLSELGQALDQKQLDEITKTGWIRVEERIARPKISLKRRRLPELLDPAGGSARNRSRALNLLRHNMKRSAKSIRHHPKEDFTLFFSLALPVQVRQRFICANRKQPSTRRTCACPGSRNCAHAPIGAAVPNSIWGWYRTVPQWAHPSPEAGRVA